MGLSSLKTCLAPLPFHYFTFSFFLPGCLLYLGIKNKKKNRITKGAEKTEIISNVTDIIDRHRLSPLLMAKMMSLCDGLLVFFFFFLIPISIFVS